jgi:hypothetical protein
MEQFLRECTDPCCMCSIDYSSETRQLLDMAATFYRYLDDYGGVQNV